MTTSHSKPQTYPVPIMRFPPTQTYHQPIDCHTQTTKQSNNQPHSLALTCTRAHLWMTTSHSKLWISPVPIRFPKSLNTLPVGYITNHWTLTLRQPTNQANHTHLHSYALTCTHAHSCSQCSKLRLVQWTSSDLFITTTTITTTTKTIESPWQGKNYKEYTKWPLHLGTCPWSPSD